jgi:hypothetical protein
MDIRRALGRLPKLTKEELAHLLQLWHHRRAGYVAGIESYPPDRMEKYGRPFLDGIDRDIARVRAELATRG